MTTDLKFIGRFVFLLIMLALSFYFFYQGCAIMNKCSQISDNIKHQSTDSSITTKKIDSIDSVSNKKINEIITSESTIKFGYVANVTAQNKELYKDGLNFAIIFFILSIAVLVLAFFLPRITNFSISPTGGLAFNLEQAVQSLQQSQNTVMESINQSGGGIPATKEMKPEAERNLKLKNIEPSLVNDDPQKNQWGGKPESNGRKLSATVVKHDWLPGLYKLTLIIKSTFVTNPLTGIVKFHLHPTFKNANPEIYVINGVAKLELIAWGAFTIGAEADNGKTKLELDLAKLPSVDSEFKQR